MTGEEFLERRFPQLTMAFIAEECGCNQSSFRTWMVRNRLPVEVGKKMSTILKVKEEEIWKHFEKARPRFKRREGNEKRLISDGNILPKLTAVTSSNLKSITFCELKYILGIHGVEDFKPATIKAIVEGRRADIE